MMLKKEKDIESICPSSREEWRQWLLENHSSKQAVWLVYYKKKTNQPTLSWSEAVDEALCFGWIDSLKKTLDEETFTQFFCKRKPNSVWSKINKEKVQQLIAKGLMTSMGHESIETAKQNGSWTTLDDAEELKIPQDLQKALEAKADSMDFFLSLSKSARKSILQWLLLAKRAETRQKRIDEVVALAAQKLKPKQFR
ncbi:YdeI family protein [Pedobacter sp. Hv1]|uniref:YdeI/OmpD-associated family protein n=1 Tax=Pedobacter sp. Hv1 TaxID=1740090 RepID=UPI000A94616A|nr:YdeI/OmpD-associated family protein [Pedobacter sp. Hv1]